VTRLAEHRQPSPCVAKQRKGIGADFVRGEVLHLDDARSHGVQTSASEAGLRNRRRVLSLGVSLALTVGALGSRAAAQKVYWTEKKSGSISRADLDGPAETLVNFQSVDPIVFGRNSQTGELYWLTGAGSTWRADASGNDLRRLPLKGLVPLFVDKETQGVFWVATPYTHAIIRTDSDGGQSETIVNRAGAYFRSAAMDVSSRRIHWGEWNSDSSSTSFYSTSIDGSDLRFGYRLPFECDVLAVDAESDRIYWSMGSGGQIACSRLDGSDIRVVAKCSRYCTRLAIDRTRKQIYWADRYVYRAGLDGTNAERVPLVCNYTSNCEITDLNLDPDAGQLFFSSPGSIVRSDLNGQQPIRILPAIRYPGAITVDPIRGKIYWLDRDLYLAIGKLQRANLDGSNIENVAPVAGWFSDSMTVDPDTGDLYISSGFDVLRVPFNTRSIEPIVRTHPWVVGGLALDPRTRKLYVAKNYTRTIQRFDLNGDNPEDWAAIEARSLAFDDLHGRLYWIHTGLNACDVSECIPQVLVPNPAPASTNSKLAIDPHSRLLFWNDASADRIRTLNLDTLEISELPLGELDLPLGVAVDPRRSGDFNNDGTVDIRDFSTFQNCLNRPDVPLDPPCVFFDTRTPARNLDLADYEIFQGALRGP
jgi:hypothetical protein